MQRWNAKHFVGVPVEPVETVGALQLPVASLQVLITCASCMLWPGMGLLLGILLFCQTKCLHQLIKGIKGRIVNSSKLGGVRLEASFDSVHVALKL